MSFIKDTLFGSKGTPSQVVNTTPQAFQSLAQPLSQALLGQLSGLMGQPYSAAPTAQTPIGGIFGNVIERLRSQFNPSAQPGQAPGQGTSPLYSGPFAAEITPGELQALGGVNAAAQQAGMPGSGQSMLSGATGFNPFAALSGLEQFGLGQVANQAFSNPLLGPGQAFLNAQLGGVMNPYAQAAGLTGAEQQGLGAIQQQAFAGNPQLQQFLGQQLGGVMNPFTQLSGAEQQGLGAIQQAAFGANPLQNTVNQQLQTIAGGGPNPLVDQLIQSATRPILENFSDEQLAQRGAFTAAGQQVQGRGSSPFAQASARLSGNAMNAVGDVATRIAAQEQQRQLTALGMAQQQPGLQLQNLLAGQAALGQPRELQSQAFREMQGNQFTAAGLGDQYASNALARALQGQNALALPREIAQTGLNLQNQAFQQMQGNQFNALGVGDQLQGNALQRALAGLGAAGTGQERQGAAFENQQNRQLQAGGELGQQQLAGQMAQLQAQLQNLQAQGLPRMVQQLGIDAGLNQFNQQQAQILNLMQLIGGLASPNTAVLPGTSGTPGLLQSFAGGVGQGLGSAVKFAPIALSDRRVKRDIVHLVTLPSGTKVYQFQYIWGGPTRIGVIADEVAHIPGAVTVDDITGLATVDYRKVA